MRLGNLGEQIVLKSERAFKSIRFAGFERAQQALYGPLPRNETKRQGRSIGSCLPKTRLRESASSTSFERG